jgi:hypothetical protein
MKKRLFCVVMTPLEIECESPWIYHVMAEGPIPAEEAAKQSFLDDEILGFPTIVELENEMSIFSFPVRQEDIIET